MRKLIAPALVGIGAFLLIVGILALLWVPGVVKKTPLDVDTVTRLSGEAAKIDPSTGGLEPRPIFAVNLTQVDSAASSDDIAVWSQRSCVAFGEERPCFDENDTNVVLLSEDDLVTVDSDIFGTDRVSAEGVAEADLPDTVVAAGGATTKGIVNKFPFDTEKKDYTYWDGTLARGVDAEFDRTETVEGVETYVFQVESAKESIMVAANTPGTYSSSKEIYVHPATGSIVKQTEEQQRWLEDGTQVLDLRIGFTDEQVAKNADEAQSNGSRLALMTTTVPLVGLIGGVLLVAAGVLLGRRNRRGATTPERELVGA